jgi:hypothetical protein
VIKVIAPAPTWDGVCPVPRAGFEPAAYSSGGTERAGTEGHTEVCGSKQSLLNALFSHRYMTSEVRSMPRLMYPSRTYDAWG